MANYLLYTDIIWEPKEHWVRAGTHLVRLAFLLRTLLESADRVQKVNRLQISLPWWWDYTSLHGWGHYNSSRVCGSKKDLRTRRVEKDLQILCRPFIKRMRAYDGGPSMGTNNHGGDDDIGWRARPDEYSDKGRPQWEKALNKLDLTAVLSIIVWACPNLESIVVSRALLFNNTLFMSMLCAELTGSKTREEPWRLGNIRSVATPFGDYWEPVSEGKAPLALSAQPQDFLAFFHLPNLETLDLGVPYRNEYPRSGIVLRGLVDISRIASRKVINISSDDSPYRPMPDHLTRLRLAFVSVPDNIFDTLLIWTSHLQHLNVRYHIYDSPLGAETLSRALINVAGTLETLEVRLTIRQDYVFRSLEEVVHQGLGSLRHLAALRSLNVPLPLLQDFLGADNRFTPLASVLPPNLESFIVNNDLCKKGMQTHRGLERQDEDWSRGWGIGDWSCRWGNAARLMQFFGGVRLAGARRRIEGGQTLDQKFDQRRQAHDEDDEGVVFEVLEDARWVEPFWEPEAGEGVGPPWKTATPQLRRLHLMGPITKLPPRNEPVPIGVKLKQELKKTCEDQGLEVKITGSKRLPRAWMGEEGGKGWGRAFEPHSDKNHSDDDEYDSDDDYLAQQ